MHLTSHRKNHTQLHPTCIRVFFEFVLRICGGPLVTRTIVIATLDPMTSFGMYVWLPGVAARPAGVLGVRLCDAHAPLIMLFPWAS